MAQDASILRFCQLLTYRDIGNRLKWLKMQVSLANLDRRSFMGEKIMSYLLCLYALCSKHQVFENATLASLLPTGGEGGSGKDATSTVAAEGGVKIKHTILPPRAKDTYQADLAESALPATAHWYAPPPYFPSLPLSYSIRSPFPIP